MTLDSVSNRHVARPCVLVVIRKCRRKDHAPKSCEEMDQEEKSSKEEHEVAEAMSKFIRDWVNIRSLLVQLEH